MVKLVEHVERLCVVLEGQMALRRLREQRIGALTQERRQVPLTVLELRDARVQRCRRLLLLRRRRRRASGLGRERANWCCGYTSWVRRRVSDKRRVSRATRRRLMTKRFCTWTPVSFTSFFADAEQGNF